MRIGNTYQGVPCKYGHDGLRYSSGHCVECSKLKAKKYREDNREKYLDVRKSFYQRHREEILQNRSKYLKTETGALKARLYQSKRRQHLRDGNVTSDDVQKLIELQKGLCVVCKSELTKYHVDHIQPLSKGGKHNFLNIQLLCQLCNQIKFNKDPIDFMQSQGYLL